MKIARLPDGKLLEFPPEFPDEEMDRYVRQQMGVPEPMSESEMAMSSIQEFSVQLSQQLSTLQQTLQMLAQLAGQSATVNQMAIEATQASSAALAQKLDQLNATMLAPRTLIRDASGAPIGVGINVTKKG